MGTGRQFWRNSRLKFRHASNTAWSYSVARPDSKAIHEPHILHGRRHALSQDQCYFERAISALEQSTVLARGERDPETAMRHFTRVSRAVLGDLDAGKKPAAIKEGERDFKVSGIFFAAPSRDHLILLADHDFPPEQRYLRISIEDSRPGFTVRTGTPVVVPNTDFDQSFRKILSSARMGSALYAPMKFGGQTLGMFNIAAQARNTYDLTDLQIAMLFANQAAATWIALGGPAYIAGVAQALGPWQASPVTTPPPPTEDIAGLQRRMHEIIERLRVRAHGSRATVRLDDVHRGWTVETPCAEALGADVPSMKSDLLVHHRSAATARWLERNRRLLVQSDLNNSDPPGPWGLVNVFNVKAQLLGPILRADDHVLGWISIHYMHKPYAIGEVEQAAMSEAIAEVRKLIGLD